MESSKSEKFIGVMEEKIGLTIWCPDFRDGQRTELCSIAETLSYVLCMWMMAGVNLRPVWYTSPQGTMLNTKHTLLLIWRNWTI